MIKTHADKRLILDYLHGQSLIKLLKLFNLFLFEFTKKTVQMFF